jgi:hypothetical protein
LLIKQDRTLFNISTKTYITKLINDFNASIYTLVFLPAINIVNKKARLLGFGKRTLICVINTNKETHILNLNKVQYLLNYDINIFKAKKLLSRSNIKIKDKNLIINQKGLSIFRFNKNIIIIEVS